MLFVNFYLVFMTRIYVFKTFFSFLFFFWSTASWPVGPRVPHVNTVGEYYYMYMRTRIIINYDCKYRVHVYNGQRSKVTFSLFSRSIEIGPNYLPAVLDYTVQNPVTLFSSTRYKLCIIIFTNMIILG